MKAKIEKSSRSDVERALQGLAHELRLLAKNAMDRGDMQYEEQDANGRPNHAQALGLYKSAHYAEALGLYKAACVAEEQLLPKSYEPTSRPWDWIESNPRKALRMVGISLRAPDGADKDLQVHVEAEDPRYPTMCVNGDLTFGISINASTGMPEGPRKCICAAWVGDFCICDLGE